MKNNNTKASALSSAILIINAVFEKTVGLVSTMILARLLVPEDFGIVATCSLIMIFVRVFGLTGYEIFFLSREGTKKSILLSGWYFELRFRIVLFILLNLAAYHISVAFDQPELQPAIHFLSFTLIVLGLKNPWIHFLEKNQNYKIRLKIVLTSKLISFVVAISLALYLQSFWALIIATMASNLSETLFSYVFIKERPILVKRTSNKFTGFVKQRIWVNLIGNIKQNFDMYFVLYLFDTATVGKFHVMKFLAMIPSMSIFTPMALPFLQEMSKNATDNKDLFYKYYVSYIYLAIAIIPFTLFCMMYSESIILIIYGEQWVEAHYFFQALVLYTLTQFLNSNSLRLLTIRDKFKTISAYETFNLISTFTIFIALRNEGLGTILLVRSIIDLAVALLFKCYTLYISFDIEDIMYFAKVNVLLILLYAAGIVIVQLIQISLDSGPLLDLVINATNFGLLFLLLASLFYMKMLKGTHYSWFMDRQLANVKNTLFRKKNVK